MIKQWRTLVMMCVMAGVVGCSQKSMEADFDSPEQAMAQARHYFWGIDGFPLNEAKALKIFEQYPDHSKSKYYRARAYEHGLGGYQKNLEKAGALYSEIASIYENVAENLAWYYLEGVGVTQDVSRAIYLYEKFAQKGSANAHYQLGLLYLDGIHLAYDTNKAYQHFQQAAEIGYSGYALTALGEMHLIGIAADFDIKKAQSYFEQAINEAFTDRYAYFHLARIYDNQNNISAMEKLLEKVSRRHFPYEKMTAFYLCDALGNASCADALYHDLIAYDPSLQTSALLALYRLKNANNTDEVSRIITGIKNINADEKLKAYVLLAELYRRGLYVEKSIQKSQKYQEKYRHEMQEQTFLTSSEIEKYYDYLKYVIAIKE